MYRYKAYGLQISSEMRIPELVERERGEADVWIRLGNIDEPPSLQEGQQSTTVRTPSGYTCYISNVGGVQVKEGDTVIACPLEGAKEKGFRFLVSGIALGLLLHQRGFVTLHASAVAHRGRGIGFVGQKGMGKSTTAAAFHAQNYAVVTDDLLALDTAEGQVVARPGFPHLKLFPEAIRGSLQTEPSQAPKIDKEGTKRSYDATTAFAEEACPLECVYVLDYGKQDTSARLPAAQPLSGREACMALIRNSFVPRLLPEEAVSEQYFRRCAAVAQSVRVCRLYREKSLAALPELVDCVEQERLAGT